MAHIDLLCVNYNTLDYVKAFLETINSDYEPGVWKVHVADNGSTDGSKDWLIDNFKRYNVTSLFVNENIGYSKAINKMASLTSSPILAALNADIWITTNHVKQVIESFENLNQAICGPKQIDSQNHIRHGGIFWDHEANPVHRGWNELDPHDLLYKDRVKCWTVSGSIYYVRRSVWDEMTNNPDYRKQHPDATGAFLPTPHYFEETFCSQHAQHLGYEVWYDGTVETAGHAWHASAPIGEPTSKYWNISRNMYIETCNAMGIAHECR